jgi:hypothetical protein
MANLVLIGIGLFILCFLWGRKFDKMEELVEHGLLGFLSFTFIMAAAISAAIGLEWGGMEILALVLSSLVLGIASFLLGLGSSWIGHKVGHGFGWLGREIFAPMARGLGTGFGWIYREALTPVGHGFGWLGREIFAPMARGLGTGFGWIYREALTPVGHGFGWLGRDVLLFLALLFYEEVLFPIGLILLDAFDWTYEKVLAPTWRDIIFVLRPIGWLIEAIMSFLQILPDEELARNPILRWIYRLPKPKPVIVSN